MKKRILVTVLLFVGLFSYCYGQDVKVNINNQDYSSQDCEYKINGICSSEDIGGVEIRGKKKWVKRAYYNDYYYFDDFYAVLTNYNPFTVTVLFQDYYCGINSVVLCANETKEVFVHPGGTKFAEPKPSEDHPYNSLKGMIVRKLGQ